MPKKCIASALIFIAVCTLLIIACDARSRGGGHIIILGQMFGGHGKGHGNFPLVLRTGGGKR